MTTRRWMVVVGVLALLIWGGRRAWLWHHFRALARAKMQTAKNCARAEQVPLESIAIFQDMIAQNEKSICELQKQDDPKLPGPERETIRHGIKMYEEQNQNLKKRVESHREGIEGFAILRRQYEAEARKYQAAADHLLWPW